MRKFLYGVLGIMALGLASCSSDEPKGPEGQVAEKDEVRYLRVAIANAPGSRAATFQDGTADECAISAMHFMFYDINGNPIKTESYTTNVEDPTLQTGAGNVNAIKSVVVQVSIPRGQQYPAYVVAMINPVNWDDVEDDKATMEELRNIERDNFSSNTGFAMTNSVYYGNDPITGQNNVRMCGAPIKQGQLFTSKQEADDATDGDIVDIYVERYAAKVNFGLANAAVEDYEFGGYNLTFVPEKWAINAAAPTMYAVKRFADTNAATSTIPTYTGVQEVLGNWTSWNDAPNFRSYWACSPGFYSTSFPQVSDDIMEAVGYEGAGQKTGDFALLYFSYNQMSGTSGRAAGVNVVETPEGAANISYAFKYAAENTMGTEAFETLNPKAAAPSAVLLGHYVLKSGETEIPVDANGFCIYKPQEKITFNGSVPTSAPAGSQTTLDALLDANKILSVTQTLDTEGNPTQMLSSAASAAVKNLFEVKHPEKEVRGDQPVPHRYVTLQLKEGLADYTGIYFRQNGTDEWKAVTADDVTLINTSLWQQIGVASCFTDSKCYFSIPIQHLGITENKREGDAAPIVDGVVNWKNVKVGDFGLVRNHVYTINVNKISGLADGIQGLDNPLVPSMEENNYWVKYQINILNWRVVPTQDVNL